MSTQEQRERFEAWFDREYPMDADGSRPKYRESMVMTLMRHAFCEAEAAAIERCAKVLEDDKWVEPTRMIRALLKNEEKTR